jgi:hypothetical protein
MQAKTIELIIKIIEIIANIFVSTRNKNENENKGGKKND